MAKKKKPKREPKGKRKSSEKTGHNKAPTGSELSVVGIGASSSGLKALSEFFKAVPPDSGLTFVVVVHLDPKRDSLLPGLLQNQTQIPVHQLEDLSLIHI